MAHNRKLVIGGVALVKVKLKHDTAAMAAIRDEIEALLVQSDFFAAAPFRWVGLVIHFGLENKFEPLYHRINKTHGDLPVSIEVDTHLLIGVDIETMKAVFRRATIEALLHIAQRYNLPSKSIEDYRNRLVQ
jgi:hypothetical protein